MLIYGQTSMLGVFILSFLFQAAFSVWFGFGTVRWCHPELVGLFVSADTVQSWSTLPLALSFGSNLFSYMKLSLPYNSSILYILCFSFKSKTF